MRERTPNEKGAHAEAKIIAAAIDMGIVVLRPLVDGQRYDIAFDYGTGSIVRVQCKWGRVADEVVAVRTSTCRFTPTRGYVRTTYAHGEIDALAIYCADLDRCYLLPAELVVGKTFLHLRLAPTRNNQQTGVTMASDYEFGAVAQLGERLAGSQKVRGSSPLSSTP